MGVLYKPEVLDTYAPNATDEWTWWCQTLVAQCGPLLEKHYASFIIIVDIDKIAAVSVNALRIRTIYAAWVNTITNYAVEKYGMHIIVGLHSLPEGVNSLDIGESFGHDAWFFNTTNSNYSLQAIDGVLSFIKNSGRIGSFTFAPINEASDNFAGFGSAVGLISNGTDRINTYVNACFAKIAQVDKRIPLMLQDCFQLPSKVSPFYDAKTNLVIDSHIYYFAAAGTYSQYLWATYASGSAFWNIKTLNRGAVDGEGSVQDYWDYESLLADGVITTVTNSSYC
ncbi:glycoside hydrolase family 5 protein [Stipitochalara longipes BDJ]|nr:glycoside hydrolase family 5 protein [Stipitochalara longipes BDJ]